MKAAKYFLILFISFCANSFSQNTTFKKIGFWPAQYPINSVEVDSEKAYIGRGNNFEIINIKDLQNTKLITKYTLPANITKIVNINISEQNKRYSVVLCNKKGVYILDVSDSNNIKEIYKLIYADIRDIDVTEDHKSIYATAFGKLLQINISDIQNPEVDTFNGINGTLIRSESNHLFIYESDGIYIYDISSLSSNPTFISSFKPTISGPGYWSVNSNFFTVHNNLIFMSCDFNGETLGVNYSTSLVCVVDISDINNPSEIHRINDLSLKDGVIKNNFAFIITSNSQLNIIDLSTYDKFSGFNFFKAASHLKYFNNNLYISDDNTGLKILNVTSPKSPSVNGRYEIQKPFYPADEIIIHGNYCYMINLIFQNPNGGIRILDISDKANPKLIGSADINESRYMTSKIIYYDDYLYAFSSENFYVFDVSDKTDPKLERSINFKGNNILDAKLSNNKLFMLQSSTHNLTVWNLSSPGNPVFVDSVAVIPGATNIDVEKNLMVISKYNQMEFLKLNENSENPAPLFWYDFHGYIYDMHLEYPNLSLAATNGYTIMQNNNGLFNYEIDLNAKTLIPKGKFISANNNESKSLIIKNNLCLLHNNQKGIYIINNADLNNPEELGLLNIIHSNSLAIDSNGTLYTTQPDSGLYILNSDLLTDAVNENTGYQPKFYYLSQNYPNPFNPTTTIKYSIPKEENVTIKIFDILGRKIKTLINDEKPAGNYKVEFDGSNLSSGVYFYQIKAGDNIETRKMLLLK